MREKISGKIIVCLHKFERVIDYPFLMMLQITESRFETGKVATYVYYVYAYDNANKEYSLHGRVKLHPDRSHSISVETMGD